MMVFRAKIAENNNEINKVYDFVKQFPLSYPNYYSWIEKCKIELEKNQKKAFFVINDEDKIVGSVIFQRHKEEKQVLEIKNFRVDSNYERQEIGSLLEREVVKYGKENEFEEIQIDSHKGEPIIKFMKKRGYELKGEECLYDERIEVILRKKI
jgi:ribosomal protein S18 acetylase RimI-like enzyme